MVDTIKRVAIILASIVLASVVAGETAAAAPSYWKQLIPRYTGIRGVSRTAVPQGGQLIVWGVGLKHLAIQNAAGQAVAATDAKTIGFMGGDDLFMRVLKIDLPVGKYTLSLPDAGQGKGNGFATTAAFQVVPAGKANKQVVISPGYHRWTKPRVLAPNTTVIAYGAVIDGCGGDLFQFAKGCRIEGGKYINFRWMSTHTASSEDMTLENCEFDGGATGGGWNKHDLTFRHCVFDRCCVTIPNASHVILDHNHFIGIGMEHAFLSAGLQQSVLMGNIFDHTPRGVVFQPRRGPVTNCLFYRNSYRGINWVGNGNEVILAEGGSYPFENNIDLYSRMEGCSGPYVEMWNAEARHNIWYDLRATGPGQIVLHAGETRSDTVQSWNLFWRCELRGGTVAFTKSASNNILLGCGFVSPSVGKRNQPGYLPKYYTPTTILQADGTANLAISCAFYDWGGWFLSKGFTLRGVIAHRPTLAGK